jgi:hypothetical protein
MKFYVESFFILKNFSINLFNRSPYFHPTTILSAWVIILITSVVLKKIIRSSNKKYKDIPENMMTSYFILFFGLIYIVDTNISSFLESAKIILMQESSVMSTGYEMKWFLHIKRLLINLIILFIYGGLIFFIEHKYKFVFKKQITFFTTTIIVIIGAYSFKAFVGQVSFLIFSEQSKTWEALSLLFIPVTLGFYVLACYLNKKQTTSPSTQKV